MPPKMPPDDPGTWHTVPDVNEPRNAVCQGENEKDRKVLNRSDLQSGARDRNRTGTPVIHEAADFKSDVSTYFTTRALPQLSNKKMFPNRYRAFFLEARPGVEPG